MFTKFRLLIFLGFLLLFTISFFNTQSALVILGLYIIGTSSLFSFNFSNPIVLLPPFIYFYNNSVLILDLSGIRPARFHDQILFVSFLSILFFYTGALLSNITFLKTPKFSDSKVIIIKHFPKLKFLFWFLFLVLLISNLFFLNSGLQSKAEASINGSYDFMGFLSRIMIFIYVVELTLFRRSSKLMTISIIILSLVTMFITGERDFFFNVILISILYFRLAYGRIKFKVFLPMFILGLLFFAFSGNFKGIALTESEVSFGVSLFLGNLFGGEFLSTGRNLETILSNTMMWDFKYGYYWLIDILRSIFPPFILPVKNSIFWFNDLFHSDQMANGYGYGFGLISEAYVQFSYFGVAFIFFALGYFICRLYRKLTKSKWHLIVYLLVIPLVIYAQRGDLSSILSPLFKQILLPLIVIYSVYKYRYGSSISRL